MDELIAAYQFYYARLISDAILAGLAPGGVHPKEAPFGTPTPHVVVDDISAIDANALGMTRMLTNIIMQASTFVTGNQIVALGLIHRRVDQLLHGTSGSAPNGGYIYGSERVRSWILPAQHDDKGSIVALQGISQYELSARATT